MEDRVISPVKPEMHWQLMKETNSHICITVLFWVCVCVCVHPYVCVCVRELPSPIQFDRKCDYRFLSCGLPYRERETRCACTVGRRLTQSLWSSSYPALSWMRLMCPWHFLSLLDTPLPAGGGQVLVMLSRTNLLSRCLVLMFSQRTATHTQVVLEADRCNIFISSSLLHGGGVRLRSGEQELKTSGSTFQLIAVRSVWNIKMMTTGVKWLFAFPRPAQ